MTKGLQSMCFSLREEEHQMNSDLDELSCSRLHFIQSAMSLQLFLSHSHTKYVKQQVSSCSTALVYHSHIEKCDLWVGKFNKLNSWRPFWKMASIAVKTQISSWQTKYSCSAPQNH